jgi:DNA sulfur modification protein DndD
LEENNKTDKKLMLVKKTEEVIDSYCKGLAELKSLNLTNEFTNIFNGLHRKKDMIHRIEINQETFDVSLYDINNKAIDKNKLSSGRWRFLQCQWFGVWQRFQGKISLLLSIHLSGV